MSSSYLDFYCPLVIFTLDWFLPFWSIAGLSISLEKRFQVQSLCRDLFLRAYWSEGLMDIFYVNTGREEELIAELAVKLDCIEAGLSTKFLQSITEKQDRRNSPAYFDDWEVIDICSLAGDELQMGFPPLSPHIAQKVKDIFLNDQFLDPRCEYLCVEVGVTDWDVYLENLKSWELFCDQGLRGWLGSVHFVSFWLEISDNLDPVERQILIKWVESCWKLLHDQEVPEEHILKTLF